MRNITEITRRDIIELFQNGYVEESMWFDDKHIIYYYWGRLSEIEFLKKLYTLDKMPSDDERYKNAEEEIRAHSSNGDWKIWVFKDDRFGLLKGEDNILKDFLCAVFHPENRDEKGYWLEYLRKIDELLRADGYELFESDKISQRSVYSIRELTPEELASGKFIPFSVRNKKAIDAKNINLLSISKKIRKEIICLFDRYDDKLYEKDEYGLDYTITYKKATFRNISENYIPKAFDECKRYSETNDFDHFIMCNYPYCVFDAIELFARYSNDNFVNEINLLLKNSGFTYKLAGGKIESAEMSLRNTAAISEPGLKELMEQATNLYNSKIVSEKQFAVEKIWDALERLKTYYTNLDKRKSVEKIINDMSNQNDKYKKLFEDEFTELTKIGNEFRIRHHETNKTDIIDNNYYSYFYHRCYALLELALKYLN